MLTRVFSLCPTVGLEGDVVVSSDLAQVFLQLSKELSVPEGLLRGRERVDVGNVGVGAGDHFSRAVQFHRARALIGEGKQAIIIIS